ncbi:putative Vsr/MutH/archaeal HJR family endonuclease [Brazilian marseillevirus]|uniref:putative Vsr/MutH/archaeal HJR family endonuclease n=1 Tax=Brazilian marseillevirus TaxID=1813599 RepID=UPI00078545D7|nr:putative Vsr/MutH/archaeal HJR family endonuclease [Brazilian marseillevirus]AMQ10862.1 putative Vsr/MutH/archaeal HJR family endonuclease [Brazilian marseillevirus]
MSLEKRTEEARRRFAAKGCTMTGEYVNAKTKIEYVCGCGKEGLFASMPSVNLETWVGCKECSDKAKKERCLKKHGVDNVAKLQTQQEKRLGTLQGKYGGKSPLAVPEIMKKKKETMKERHGVEHPLQSKEILEKRERTAASSGKRNLEEANKALKEKYGEKGPLGNPEVREKVAETRKKNGNKRKPQKEYDGSKRLLKSIEMAKAHFSGKGCTMTGEYADNKTPVEYTCKCGSKGNMVSTKTVQKKSWVGCKDCSKERTKVKNMEEYGVDHPMKSKEFREKVKETLKKNHGVDVPLKSQKIREKKNATMKEKYGEEHSAQVPEIMEKIKSTTKELYGVSCVFMTPENKEKTRQGKLAKFGQGGSMSHPEIRLKVAQTMLKRYGKEHALQVPEFKEKLLNTYKERFKADHPFHTDEVYSKVLRSCFKVKEFTFPSGRTVPYQGYEHYAILLLLKEGHQEEDIVSCHESIMGFMYEDGKIKRKYYPDLFVPSSDTIVEVKSTWTYEKTSEEKERVLKKLEACRREGYNTRLLVFSPKGEVLLDEKKDKGE